jgi:hypothetical protein
MINHPVAQTQHWVTIHLHKPHPGNELKAYVKRQVVEHLKAGGLI